MTVAVEEEVCGCGFNTMSDVNEIDYMKLTHTDLDEVLDFLAKEFYPRESLSKGGSISGEMPGSVAHTKMILSWLNSGVSVGARDKATGSLIGMRMSNINTRGSEMEEPQFISEKMKKFRLVMKKAIGLYDVFQEEDVDSVLEFHRLCVHSDYCRRGIAQKMVKMCMELAAEKGCQLVRSLVTSPYTEKLYLRLGFQSMAELDLRKHGNDLFDLSLMHYTSVKVMTKRL